MVIFICVVLLLYLVAIMPRMFGRPDIRPFYQWYYAHRGLHDNKSDAPENSRNAFQRAIDAGFGIELDVQLTKDLIPVVFHDYTLERICGINGKVKEYTFDELQEFSLCDSNQRIPGLSEVLELVNGRVPLIVELKVPDKDMTLYPLADNILQNYKGMYCIESFNPLCLFWYRKNRPQIVRGQLAEAFYRGNEYRGTLYFALQHLLLNFISKPDFVAYNHKHRDVPARRLCRSLYKNTAVAWTIKSETELAEARKYFDMFIFDSFVPDRKGE